MKYLFILLILGIFIPLKAVEIHTRIIGEKFREIEELKRKCK